MNNRIIKICLFSAILGGLTLNADAQRTSKKKQQQQQTSNNGAQTQEQQNNKTPITNFNSKIPILVDSSGEGNDTAVKRSLRNDDVFDKSFANERTPLPYENLRWDDALYSEKVWRELDLREKMNQTFRNNSDDDNGNQMFINILLKAVNNGTVTAFSPNDDRFTTPMQISEIQQLTLGSADTAEVRKIDQPDVIDHYIVTRASFDAKSVTKLRIKEEWVFDREASRMFVRILGIAPLKTVFNPDGSERGSSVMFWVYYPDLRPLLAKYEVYNPKNLGYGRMTWEELFESRMFSSYIVKSTLDNPSNKTIKAMLKDPILSLLEGDNIRERMFNYEQDLWSY